jgi:hypothetical protein
VSLVALALVVGGALLLGSRLGPLLASEGEDRFFRLTLYGVAGLVLLYLGLLLLQAAGVAWRPAPLAAATVALILGAHLAVRRFLPAPGPARASVGWGDAVAALALLAVAVAAAQGWNVNLDFVYHWGIKGQKFYLAGGIDYAFLAEPWNIHRHPSYPNLLPSLFAASAAAAGRFEAATLLLWTALFFAMLLAAAREALRLAAVSPFARRSTLALVALGTAMAGVGHQTIGGPDWILALAVLAGYALLLRPVDRAPDLALGMTAALAAAAKIEGMPLAAMLVALHLLRRRGAGLRPIIPTVLPPLLVIAAWGFQAVRHGLLVEPPPGLPDWASLGLVVRAALDNLATPAWHHAGFLLLLLPALWAVAATRPAAALCTGQLLFYLYVFLGWPDHTAAGVGFFVRSGFARLALHLFPAVLVACGVALDRWCEESWRATTAPPARTAPPAPCPAPGRGPGSPRPCPRRRAGPWRRGASRRRPLQGRRTGRRR